MKIAVVYWSSTGNTETMAQAVQEGAKHAGAEAELFTAAEFDGGKMDEFDAVAFGCPAMGAEVLEDFHERHLIAFGGEWSVGFLLKHNPGLELSDSLSV